MARFGEDEGRTLSQRLRRSAATYKDDPIPTKVREGWLLLVVVLLLLLLWWWWWT